MNLKYGYEYLKKNTFDKDEIQINETLLIL